MSIVFLCASFYPNIGGVEKHVFEVAKRFSKRGYRVIVVVEGENDKKYKIGKIYVHQFYFGKKGWLKKFKIWKKLFLNRKLLQKADIVHCHDVFFWYIPFRFLYLRKKVYTTFHGYETKFPPTDKAIFIRKLSERLSFGNICVGDYIKNWYGTNPTFVTYGATEKSNEFRLRPKGNKGGKLKILFIGRIEEDNGIKIYTKALEILGKSKFQLEVCGDGSLKKEFEKFGIVHGFVKKVEDYILNSDIVFVSSYLSIIKALIFKKPVSAVYDNPLKEDYLKMSPFSKFITITRSPKKLADTIKSLRSKQIEKRTNLGYEWAKKQNWDRVTNLYLNLFKL